MNWTNVYGLDQLGAFLRGARKEKGYTQDEFAEVIGASHATLSALENGKSVTSKTLMTAINDLGLRLVVLPKGESVRVGEPGDAFAPAASAVSPLDREGAQ